MDRHLRPAGGDNLERVLSMLLPPKPPKVAHHHPDLILMDIQLPILDGYETTRRIRNNPDLDSIPIIAVTSYALSGDEAKAPAAGCNAYVTKPYSPRVLLAKVREYLDTKPTALNPLRKSVA